MARWAPQKKDVLDALAAEVLHNYGRGRAILAVDGPDGAATRLLADDLAVSFRDAGHHVVRASIDGFSRSRAQRHARGSDSAAGRYEDSFDYSTFRRVLVEPFRMGHGASFVTSAFDPARDAPVQTKWHTAPNDAILIVDGEFLNRPELKGIWNYSIWLDPPTDTEAGSAASRLYVTEAAPRTTATAIIDGQDPEHPRRVFADSC